MLCCPSTLLCVYAIFNRSCGEKIGAFYRGRRNCALNLLLTLAGAYWSIKFSFHSSSRPLAMACPARKTERVVRSWKCFCMVVELRSCSYKKTAYFGISTGEIVKSRFFIMASSLESDTTILPDGYASMHRALWVNLPFSYKYSVGVVVQGHNNVIAAHVRKE